MKRLYVFLDPSESGYVCVNARSLKQAKRHIADAMGISRKVLRIADEFEGA